MKLPADNLPRLLVMLFRDSHVWSIAGGRGRALFFPVIVSLMVMFGPIEARAEEKLVPQEDIPMLVNPPRYITPSDGAEVLEIMQPVDSGELTTDLQKFAPLSEEMEVVAKDRSRNIDIFLNVGAEDNIVINSDYRGHNLSEFPRFYYEPGIGYYLPDSFIYLQVSLLHSYSKFDYNMSINGYVCDVDISGECRHFTDNETVDTVMQGIGLQTGIGFYQSLSDKGFADDVMILSFNLRQTNEYITQRWNAQYGQTKGNKHTDNAYGLGLLVNYTLRLSSLRFEVYGGYSMINTNLVLGGNPAVRSYGESPPSTRSLNSYLGGIKLGLEFPL